MDELMFENFFGRKKDAPADDIVDSYIKEGNYGGAISKLEEKNEFARAKTVILDGVSLGKILLGERDRILDLKVYNTDSNFLRELGNRYSNKDMFGTALKVLGMYYDITGDANVFKELQINALDEEPRVSVDIHTRYGLTVPHEKCDSAAEKMVNKWNASKTPADILLAYNIISAADDTWPDKKAAENAVRKLYTTYVTLLFSDIAGKGEPVADYEHSAGSKKAALEFKTLVEMHPQSTQEIENLYLNIFDLPDNKMSQADKADTLTTAALTFADRDLLYNVVELVASKPKGYSPDTTFNVGKQEIRVMEPANVDLTIATEEEFFGHLMGYIKGIGSPALGVNGIGRAYLELAKKEPGKESIFKELIKTAVHEFYTSRER